jgi:hypothetical protein
VIPQKQFFLVLLLLVLTGVVACGGDEDPAVDSAATAIPEVVVVSPIAASPDESTVIADTDSAYEVVPSATAAKPESDLSAQETAAVGIMWKMIGGFGDISEGAVISAGVNGHPGLIPVLVEAASRTFEPDLALEISRALERITGEAVGGDYVLTAPWFSWMSRQNPPQVLLPEFDEWKSELLGTIDPSFKEFLYGGVSSRIPLWAVQWGGVVRDGIPPLEFPDVVPGNRVDFLNPDEPVFGVTINGESRAYPHRIMGWHELANDRLGGELITFVF